MKTSKWIFCLFFLAPVFTSGQIKGYRTIEKLRYAVADSVDKGKGRYYPMAPLDFFGDSTVRDVYTDGNVFLHDLVYRFISQFNGIELVSEERHHYLVYAKDSSYGFDWNGYKEFSSVVQRIQIDSLLRNQWKKGFISNYEERFPADSFKLVSSASDPNSGILTEVYKPVRSSDSCGGATLSFIYSQDQTKGIPAPARLPGMYITDIRMIAACVACKFEISFRLQPIDKIKQPIAEIFQAYAEKKLELISGTISTDFN
jgi:hypothetical protein